MIVAIIPARGGSKRIPKKNIKDFCGKPMIAYAIEAAKKSNLFEHILVSTDDEEIADVAVKYGAEVPFLRPENLADDHTATVPVISHAVKFCQKLGWDISFACCIYPCTPFLLNEDLNKSFEILKSSKTDFVYPVTEYPHPIQRAMKQLKSGQMEFFNFKYELSRTQDLEKSFHDAGQFYWGTSNAWIHEKKMHTDGMGMIIPNWRVVDIDSNDDWARAEIIFKTFYKKVT
jgi:pseudaminic acid cytidylyltransferase